LLGRRSRADRSASYGETGGMQQKSIEQQFAVALEALVEQIKRDRSVLAAILCGSLSHDTVWA
jgi:hypothetical protein